MKRCSRCKEEKLATEFYRNSKNSDGLRTECKPCCKSDTQERWSRPTQKTSPANKHCNRCDVTKPAADFYKNIRHTDRLSTYCKICTQSLRPAYTKDERRNFQYQSDYGITLADYDRMFAEQGGQCAICGTTDPGNANVKHFSVDHCHATGRVRGLLCERCNRGLGHYDDQPDRLEAAASYLRKHTDGC